MSTKTKTMTKKSMNIKNYAAFLEQLKKRVREAQIKAAVSVNIELIKLYWDIGKAIVEKQEKEGWGSQIIEKLCRDIQNAFPGIQGFSRANIFYMRSFYLNYSKVQQAVGQLDELPIARIPWGHNVLIITKIKDINECLWYAQQVIENGLSRNTLEDWITSKAYKRRGKAITNFKDRLPAAQSELAQETLNKTIYSDKLFLQCKNHIPN